MKVYIKKNPNKSSRFKWITIAEFKDNLFLYITTTVYQQAKMYYNAYAQSDVHAMRMTAKNGNFDLKNEYLRLTGEEFKFSA